MARTAVLLCMLGLCGGSAWAVEPVEPVEPAMTPDAREHFDRGAVLAEQRNYEEASRAFEASHEIEPRKESLFAWAQVERLRGNCTAAIALYRRFLDSARLTSAQVEAARGHVGRCERVLAEAAAETPPPPVGVAERHRSAEPPPARSLVLAGIFAAAGVAAWAGAGTFYLLSLKDEREAQRADIDLPTYDGAVDRARGKQRLAAGLAVGGILLGDAALLQWLWRGSDEGWATAWVSNGAGGAAWGVRF